VKACAQAVSGLLDLLYPPVCAACGGAAGPESRALCWDCRTTIAWIQAPYCARCGNPLSGALTGPYTCALCSRLQPAYAQALSAARLDGPVRELLRRFKYHGALWVLDELGPMIEAAARRLTDPHPVDGIAWVPLFPARQRERGFNQARLLAEYLCVRLGKPLYPKALKRTRPTPSQTRLTARARAENVRGAFRGRPGAFPKGASVLLVDDVMTTGATVNACANALLHTGAGRVAVVTVARR